MEYQKQMKPKARSLAYSNIDPVVQKKIAKIEDWLRKTQMTLA